MGELPPPRVAMKRHDLTPLLSLSLSLTRLRAGNNRGTSYSLEHTTLKPGFDSWDEEFWDFSWGDMAEYDLPAEMRHILDTTGAEKLAYIGHSQVSFLLFCHRAATFSETKPSLTSPPLPREPPKHLLPSPCPSSPNWRRE